MSETAPAPSAPAPSSTPAPDAASSLFPSTPTSSAPDQSSVPSPSTGAEQPAAAEAPHTPLEAPLVAPKSEEAASAPTDPPKTDEPPATEADMKADDYVLDPLPEGLTREDPLLTSFLEGAARGKMDQESVNAVIKSMAPKISEHLMAPQKAWVEMNQGWKNEIMADPVIGGENFQAKTLPTIQAALQQFGDPKIFEALHVTGAGNHPAVVRTLYQLASQVTEAKTGPVAATNPPPQPDQALARMYPTAKAG